LLGRQVDHQLLDGAADPAAGWLGRQHQIPIFRELRLGPTARALPSHKV
jgi:hypothetical protein